MKPSWDMLDQFVVNSLQSVMALDALRSSHPVNVPVNDPATINEIFDDISYKKGQCFQRSYSRRQTLCVANKNFFSGLKE